MVTIRWGILWGLEIKSEFLTNIFFICTRSALYESKNTSSETVPIALNCTALYNGSTFFIFLGFVFEEVLMSNSSHLIVLFPV
jgi:hypothetical protein